MYFDDIKNGRTNSEHAEAIKDVLEEPVSFTDQVHLGCSQRAAQVKYLKCDGKTRIVFKADQHKHRGQMARAELRTKERLWFCELPDSPVFDSHLHPTKVARTTSIMEPLSIEPTNVTNCPRLVHQPQHTHGRTDHGLKHIFFMARSLVFLAGEFTGLSDPSKCHKLAVATLIQKDHSQVTDGLQLTPLVTNASRTTFTQDQFVSFFCSGESFIFQHE